jgi:hypothetical protein
MACHFWVVETVKSLVDPSPHFHVVFALNAPKQSCVAGPFETESAALDWIVQWQSERDKIPF